MSTPQQCSCITCRDQATEMRVLEYDPVRGMALCEDREGGRRTVDLALLDPARRGDVVLVHADVAIARVEPQAAR